MAQDLDYYDPGNRRKHLSPRAQMTRERGARLRILLCLLVGAHGLGGLGCAGRPRDCGDCSPPSVRRVDIAGVYVLDRCSLRAAAARPRRPRGLRGPVGEVEFLSPVAPITSYRVHVVLHPDGCFWLRANGFPVSDRPLILDEAGAIRSAPDYPERWYVMLDWWELAGRWSRRDGGVHFEGVETQFLCVILPGGGLAWEKVGDVELVLRRTRGPGGVALCPSRRRT